MEGISPAANIMGMIYWLGTGNWINREGPEDDLPVVGERAFHEYVDSLRK